MSTIRIGVDLGTTNSAIAVFNSGSPQIIKSNISQDCTPSAVCETKVMGECVRYVGANAKEMLMADPSNVEVEFKLKMGMRDWHARFPSTGAEYSAVELSAEVLRELMQSYQQLMGEDLRAMVITVPAAFTNPEHEDTMLAGKLAGLEYVETLSEPVAAAHAFGFALDDVPDQAIWLVYDLGGGTFDAALVGVDGGIFKVFANAGDKYNGGKNIDAAIVEHHFMPKLPSEVREKIVPWKSAEWWMLKSKAENAKIGLSKSKRVSVQADFPEQKTDFSCFLTQDELNVIQAPIIAKTLDICRELLQANQYESKDIERVCLVGGPTLSSYVREQVSKGLGIRLEHRVHALSAVAMGAAVYAQGRQWHPKESDVGAEVEVSLDFEGLTVDKEPLVTGSITSRDENQAGTIWRIEVERRDKAGVSVWQSPKVETNEDGAFSVHLACEAPDVSKGEKVRENRFWITVRDPEGRTPAMDIDGEFSITVGMESSKPQLPRGIGVATSDGGVLWYFDAGQPLKCEKTEVLRTTRALRKGTTETEALVIPVVEEGIDKHEAMFNPHIGSLLVKAEHVSTSIPEGAPIDVTIAVDESRHITVSASFPDYDVEPEPLVIQNIPQPDKSELEKKLGSICETIDVLKRFAAEDEEMRQVLDEVKASGLMDAISKSISEMSSEHPDAGQMAERDIMKLLKLVRPVTGKAQRFHGWAQLESQFRQNVAAVESLVTLLDEQNSMPAAEMMKFKLLVKKFEEACERRDIEAAQELAYGELPGLPTVTTYTSPGGPESPVPIATGVAPGLKSTVRKK